MHIHRERETGRTERETGQVAAMALEAVATARCGSGCGGRDQNGSWLGRRVHLQQRRGRRRPTAVPPLRETVAAALLPR